MNEKKDVKSLELKYQKIFQSPIFEDLLVASVKDASDAITRKADLFSGGDTNIHIGFYQSSIMTLIQHYYDAMKGQELPSLAEYLREMADKFEGKDK